MDVVQLSERKESLRHSANFYLGLNESVQTQRGSHDLKFINGLSFNGCGGKQFVLTDCGQKSLGKEKTSKISLTDPIQFKK